MAERNPEPVEQDEPVEHAAADALVLPDDAVCLQCGYRLVNLPEPRCPECGRAFDTADGTTYGPIPRYDPVRWLFAPPKAITYYVFPFFTIMLLLIVSDPHCWESYTAIAGLVVTLLLLFAVVYTALNGFVILAYEHWLIAPRKKRAVKRKLVRWLVYPICILALGSTMLWPWPVYIRFQLSKPWLDDFAQKYDKIDFEHGRWVGLFYIEHFYVDRRSVIIYTDYPGFPFPAGFRFDPNDQLHLEHPYGNPYLPTNIRLASKWFLY